MSNEKPEPRVLTVSNTTSVEQLGKSVYSTYAKEGLEQFAVQAIGSGAMAQAIKGIASANGLLGQCGRYASVVPAFYSTNLRADESKSVSAISLNITIRTLGE